MAFRVITGTFHVVGYSPDGDSIRFKADNLLDWKELEGPPVKLNKKEHVQLRFEAVDTLETHYSGAHHQPEVLAVNARDFLLKSLGINSIIWNKQKTEILQANDETPGYILSKVIEKNRRPVAFVFSGTVPTSFSDEVFLKESHLKMSINLQLIKEGLAYPTFYSGLFHELRDLFIQETILARNNALGIWKTDKTNSGFSFPNIQDLEEDLVILPKLFRRLIEFLKNNQNMSQFKDFLKEKEEKIMLLDNQHFTHFDNIVDISKSRIKLTENPENIIFME